MATKAITLERAKGEIVRLQYFVNLVESYEPSTIEEEIVREYAIVSSIPKVSDKLNVSHEKVVNVIRRKGKDELHKMVRSMYMNKIKERRR